MVAALVRIALRRPYTFIVLAILIALFGTLAATRMATDIFPDIDHIESQSLNGIGIVKIFFHPGVDIRTATAQVTSVSQTVLKQMPPGITPPLIVNYSAAT